MVGVSPRSRWAISGVLGLAAASLFAAAAAPRGEPGPWAATETQAYLPPDASVSGAVPNDTVVRVTVALRLRNRGEFQRQLDQRLRPLGGNRAASADVEQFLPSRPQAEAVRTFLMNADFSAVRISANRLLVTAEASAGTIRRTFETDLVYATRAGRRGIINSRPARVPSALGGTVLSVLGLQTLDRYEPLFRGAVTPLVCMLPPHRTLDCGGTGGKGFGGYNPTIFPGIYSAGALPVATQTRIGIIAEGDLTPAIDDLHAFESVNAS